MKPQALRPSLARRSCSIPTLTVASQADWSSLTSHLRSCAWCRHNMKLLYRSFDTRQSAHGVRGRGKDDPLSAQGPRNHVVCHANQCRKDSKRQRTGDAYLNSWPKQGLMASRYAVSALDGARAVLKGTRFSDLKTSKSSTLSGSMFNLSNYTPASRSAKVAPVQPKPKAAWRCECGF